MGDFNLPKIDWETWETDSTNLNDLENKYLEAIQDSFLYQYITKPTRNRINNNPSILDLVLTNKQGMVSEVEIIRCKSDHSWITFWFNCYVEYHFFLNSQDSCMTRLIMM